LYHEVSAIYQKLHCYYSLYHPQHWDLDSNQGQELLSQDIQNSSEFKEGDFWMG